MLSNGGNIDVIIISADEARDVIPALLKDYYKEEIESTVISRLDVYLDTLREDLFFLIEYPYVDRVYRDSYYSYFSSKHQNYYRDSIRIAVFSKEIKLSDFRSLEKRDFLQKNYLGFFTIRPTFPSVFGRAVLSKDAYEDNDFLLMTYEDCCLINGVKLTVSGFPHSSQDRESISCAETTIWALMEYFSGRYAQYKPVLPSEIISVLSKYSEERLLPTSGLGGDQISFALKEFAFGTRIYSKGAFGEDFHDIIGYYVESGIPIVAILENENLAHAILIIGKEKVKISKENFTSENKEELKNGKSYYEYVRFVEKYLVNDDNDPPYKCISLSSPTEGYSDENFKDCKIVSVIVPLYPKIYLEADRAKKLTVNIIQDVDFGYDFENEFIFRFYLTSSKSYKNYISGLGNMNADLQDSIVLSTMPKFIWVAEIYSKESILSNNAIGLVLVDATEANAIDMNSLIFASYPDRSISIINNNLVPLPFHLQGYALFNNNLQ